jgi:hypothetical protein
MNGVDDLFLDAIENTARRHNQLAIRQATQLGWDGTHARKPLKRFDGSEYLLDQLTGRGGFLERNIIRNRLQILNRRVSPDYFSHRFNRCFARTWVEIRPSFIAFSPRAIPSRSRIRF